MLDNLTLRPQYVVSPLEAAFQAFLLDREAARCTPKTLEHYQYTLGSFIAYLQGLGIQDVGEIAPQHIRAYLVNLQKRGLKDTTQHAHARGIRAWLNWLVREGDLERSPMEKVAMPRLEKRIPPPFSPEEIRALLSVCDRQTPKGARNYAILLTLLDTGLRASEFVSLRIGDIDMRTGLCTVMGKGQKQRMVRVGSKARKAILRMLAFRARPANGDPLWVGFDGAGRERGALSRAGLQTLLYRLGKRAGVHPCAPHRFRRTFALW
ncbi:MAG: tyrosine-type recombinase/integrase, partial [Anaerolineae bacterium]|nr:tyrosine-type recombinase/integrase [Anaerolineae bacterium]